METELMADLIVEIFFRLLVKSWQLFVSLLPLSMSIKDDVWKRRQHKFDERRVHKTLRKLNTDDYIHARMAMKARALSS